MLSRKQISIIWIGVLLAMFIVGCKKKAPPPPPPPPPKVEAPAPPPPPPAPSVTLSAEPTTIERGQSATLRWSVTGNATDISIDNGIGTVQATGTRRVFPSDSTTYTLTAKGPGGSNSATATVNVTAPPPPPPPPPPPAKPSLSEMLASQVQDAYFDYDKSDIREDARNTLTRDAEALKNILRDFPDATIMVEGNADERGSAEYNLGLGDRRAQAAKDFLVQLGVPADRLKTISYGKERPVCTEHNEACWQQNRRVHFSAGQ